jgi:hypothetical protein
MNLVNGKQSEDGSPNDILSMSVHLLKRSSATVYFINGLTLFNIVEKKISFRQEAVGLFQKRLRFISSLFDYSSPIIDVEKNLNSTDVFHKILFLISRIEEVLVEIFIIINDILLLTSIFRIIWLIPIASLICIPHL